MCEFIEAAFGYESRDADLELLGMTPPGQGLRQLQERFNGWHRWESQVVSMEMA